MKTTKTELPIILHATTVNKIHSHHINLVLAEMYGSRTVYRVLVRDIIEDEVGDGWLLDETSNLFEATDTFKGAVNAVGNDYHGTPAEALESLRDWLNKS